jgi:hypothetical protein
MRSRSDEMRSYEQRLRRLEEAHCTCRIGIRIVIIDDDRLVDDWAADYFCEVHRQCKEVGYAITIDLRWPAGAPRAPLH